MTLTDLELMIRSYANVTWPNRASLKNIMFPVQLVTEMLTSRAAAISVFVPLFVILFSQKNGRN